MGAVVNIIPGFTPRTRSLLGPTGIGTSGQVLTSDGAGGTSWQNAAGGVTDHGALTGLGDDDHTQYALLAGRAGGQTLIGGTASGNTLTLKGEAGDAALIVSASGHVCTVRQTASVPGVLFTGPGRIGGTDATDGITQFVSVNIPGNRQFAIGPSDGWTNAAVRFFRYAFVGGGATLDAIDGTGQRADMLFGNGTTNVTFGADLLGPSTVKAFFGGEAAKVCAAYRMAVGQTANALEVQNSDGSVAWAIGPKGAIKPVSLADTDAPNGSIYYSTTQSKLVYKDSGGGVNALY